MYQGAASLRWISPFSHGRARALAQLSALLDVIVPHAYRWCTLNVHLNSRYCLQSMLDKINYLKFPSLERAAVIATAYIKYPTFLYPENSPALQNLKLRPLVPIGRLSLWPRDHGPLVAVLSSTPRSADTAVSAVVR